MEKFTYEQSREDRGQEVVYSDQIKSRQILMTVIAWIVPPGTDVNVKRYLLEWLSSADLDKETGHQLTIKRQLQPFLPVLLNNNGDLTLVDKNDRTLLHLCILKMKSDSFKRRHDAWLVSHLCKLGASIMADDCDGYTPLGLALGMQRMDLVDFMLSSGNISSINRNRLGQTALYILIDKYSSDYNFYTKYYTLFWILIPSRISLNEADIYGQKIIHLVAKLLDTNLLKQFKSLGADFQARTNLGDDLLIIACKSIRQGFNISEVLGLINFLLNSEGYSANYNNNKGFTALHYAARSNDSNIIQALVMAGANIHATASDGTNPFHSAITSSSFDVMRYFIKRKVRLDLKDCFYNFTLLHMAAFNHDDLIIKWLLENGFNSNESGLHGLTPLHLAAMVGNANVVGALINFNADVNCRDSHFNYTPMHFASMAGKFATIPEFDEDSSLVSHCFDGFKRQGFPGADYKATILALWQAGADVNAKDRLDCTPLHYVTQQTGDELLTVLLATGAHVDVQDCKYFTPLQNCLINGNYEGLNCLLISGANINNIEHPTEKIIEKMKHSINYNESYIQRYLVKLRVADLAINDIYKSCLSNSVWDYDSYTTCVHELKKLKERMLVPGISFYDLLHMNYKRRAEFANRLPDNLDVEFPCYSIVIKNKCNEAVNRVSLLGRAKKAYQLINEVQWPDLCVEHIMSFLNNITLRVIVNSLNEH